MPADQNYQQVCDHVRQTALLQSTLALLEWDQHTKMPSQAAGYRADQITALATQIHQRRTDKTFGELLSELAEKPFDNDELASVASNIRTLKHDFDRHSKIPESLAAELARASSEGQTAWITARQKTTSPVSLRC